MKHFRTMLLRGFVTFLPIAITIYFFYWLVLTSERMLRPLIIAVVSEDYYIPGLGLLLTVTLFYLIGLFSSFWLGRFFMGIGGKIVEQVPLVKSIYGSMKDLLKFFDFSHEKKLNKPALLEFPEQNLRFICFVTQENLESLESAAPVKKDDLVVVYLPMSYQIGGYTVIVPRERLTVLDMSIEQAMKFVVTAGISASEKK
jgi:uncharacterized membrane protein